MSPSTDICVKKKQLDHFNVMANKYISSRSHNLCCAYKSEIWSKFLTHLPTKNYNVISDLMSGNAEAHSYLKQSGISYKNYYAIDQSPEMLSFIKDHTITALCSEITECSIPSSDLTLIIGGLHHIPNHAQQVLINVKKNLTQNGNAIIIEPTSSNIFFSIIRWLIYRKNNTFEHNSEKAFTNTQLENMFKNAGLKIEKTFYFGFIGYVIYYNLDAFPKLFINNTRINKLLSKVDSYLMSFRFIRYVSFATCYILSHDS
jgi:SAM-dependent methyltransferase